MEIIQEEFGVAAAGGLEQGIPISRRLRNWLAERKRVDVAVLASEVEMMSRDRSC